MEKVDPIKWRNNVFRKAYEGLQKFEDVRVNIDEKIDARWSAFGYEPWK